MLKLRPFGFLPGFGSRALFAVCRRIQHRKRAARGGLFSLGRVYYGRGLLRQLPASHLIHLHWVVDMVDYQTMLPKMARRCPLVWSFHDMNCFTGGCHYDGGCGRFRTACGSCPQLSSDREHDLSRQVFLRKEHALARIPTERLAVICPSEWMARGVTKSPLFSRFPRVTIPNGVDANVFRPTPRQEARHKLRLPEDARILLFVSDIISDKRKGFSVLLRALQELRESSNLLLLTLGSKCETTIQAARHRHLGRIQDPSHLALAYSAADVFINPSLEDNLPNTILEAMSCGLPVIAFRTGGIPEMVRDAETGHLVPVGNVRDLTQAITSILLDNRQRQRMSAMAREQVLQRFTVQGQAAACEALYRNHLSNQHEKAA